MKNRSKFSIKELGKLQFLHEKIDIQSKSWWIKPEMLKKAGGQFNFKNTLAY